jgi:hypothetical protein
MPEFIVVLRIALLLGLLVAVLALLAWLWRPRVRRQLDDAGLIPWRAEDP